MARRKSHGDPFIVDGIGDVEELNRWPTVYKYLDDWRAKLNDIVSRFNDESPNSVRGKQAIDAKDALVQVDILERGNNATMYLEAAVKLGILFERMSLRPFEPWIGRSPSVSKANSIKAKSRSKLGDDEKPKVFAAIDKQHKAGVTIREACKQVARQLTTGVFRPLGKKKIPIEAEALRSIWNQRNRRR